MPLEDPSSPSPLSHPGAATITLTLSVDPWAYQAAQLPAAAYRTPGPRTVVLQVCGRGGTGKVHEPCLLSMQLLLGWSGVMVGGVTG